MGVFLYGTGRWRAGDDKDVYSPIKYAVPNKKLWMYIEYAEKTQYDDAVFQWTVMPLPFMRSD